MKNLFKRLGIRHLLCCLMILFAFGMRAQGQQSPLFIVGPQSVCPTDSSHYALYIDLNLGCVTYETEWSVEGQEDGYRVGSGGGEVSAYMDIVWLVSGDYTVICEGTIFPDESIGIEEIPFVLSLNVTVQETGVLTLADESGALEQSVCADAEIEPIIFDATNASPDYLVTDGDFSGLTIEWINNDTQLSITGTPEYPLTFTVATGNENCPNGPAQTITIDIIKYDITASVEGAGGTITSITPATVDCGGTSTIIFDPEDCQEIKTVKDNNEDVTALVTNNTYVINDIQENHNVIVTFGAIQYNITASVANEEGGTVTVEPGTVDCDGTSTVTFAPDDCYQIVEVTDNEEDVTELVVKDKYVIENIQDDHAVVVTYGKIPYTITATVVGGVGGTATVDPATVDCGGTSTIIFDPEDCQEIKTVKDNNEDVTALVTNNTYVINDIQENHAVEVTFGLIEYTITATVVGEGGTIDPSGEVVVNCGKDTTFTMTPGECYQISQVLVDGEDVIEEVEIDDDGIGSYTFRGVTEDHTISVAFELIPYTITATVVGEGGTIDPSGEVVVNCGKDTTFTMTPGECYQISQVLVDGEDVIEEVEIDDDGIGSYTFRGVTEDHTISVAFELIPYTITATVVGEGGTIDPIGEVVVNCGKDTTFTMTPDECYQISQVLVDGEDVTEEVAIDDDGIGSYTFASVTEDHTISVAFELIPYTITATVVGEGGTINPIGEVIVDCGTNKTFNFTPAACNQIKEVKVDGVVIPTANSYTFNNVTANHTISVEFELIPYTITATVVGEGGTIDPIGEVIVDCGTNKTFNFTPAACNQIKEVKVDGVVIPTANSYTFNNVTANHTISVEFELIPYTITATVVGEGGTIDPSGEVVVNCGKDTTFTMTPDECYQISQVLVDGEDVTEEVAIDDDGIGSYTFASVTEDHTISVAFELIPYEIIGSVKNNEGGSITPMDTIADCGSSILFTMTPDVCYRIKKVWDVYEEKDISNDITALATGVGYYLLENITADHKIEVTFEKISYTITGVVEGEGGSIDPEELVIDCGENYEVSIDADECYQVLKVTDNGVDVTAQLFQGQIYNLENITADHEIIATFEKIPYEIIGTVWDNEGGSITPMDTIANCGDSIVFTMTPDACYRIKEVRDIYEEKDITGDVEIDATTGVGSYTLSNITDEHHIRVEFELIYYTITATTDGNGTIDPDGEVFVNCGDSKEFCFVATHNYEIEKVTVNGVDLFGYAGDTLGCYTFTNVIADGTIHVTFKEIEPEPVLYGCPVFTPIDTLHMEEFGSGWINVGDLIPLRIEGKGNITIYNVLWHSTNPNTAVVNPVSGLTTTATAVGPGATNIIATIQTDRGEFILTCYFEVIQPVTGVIMTPTQLTMNLNTERQLVATVLPENASIKNVIWTSDSTDIVTVNQNGVIRAIAPGSAIVTVTTIDGGFTATCLITVPYTPPTSITVIPKTLTIGINETYTLNVEIKPAEGDPNVTWTSSNPSIATVDANGVVTGVKAGKATITVKTVNNFKSTCTVTVTSSSSPAPAPGTNILEDEIENISLFPNPTSGELQIKNVESKINTVQLFDLNGRMVIEKKNVDSNEASIDMTGLVEGVYFISIDGKTMKVVKR